MLWEPSSGGLTGCESSKACNLAYLALHSRVNGGQGSRGHILAFPTGGAVHDGCPILRMRVMPCAAGP